MPSKTLTIINKRGLHARAAAKFANVAAEFACDIQARSPGQENWVDGKSVMSLMLLAASQGSELELYTDGEDADQAMERLCALVNNYFDEGE